MSNRYLWIDCGKETVHNYLHFILTFFNKILYNNKIVIYLNVKYMYFIVWHVKVRIFVENEYRNPFV